MIRDILFLLALFVVIRLALDKPVLTTRARKSMQNICNLIKVNKGVITTFVIGGGVGSIIGLLAWNNQWI